MFLFVNLLPVRHGVLLIRSGNCSPFASTWVHRRFLVLRTFLVFCVVLCTQCCQCLCIVHSWFALRFSLTFISSLKTAMVCVMKAEYLNHANMIGWKHRNKRYLFFFTIVLFWIWHICKHTADLLVYICWGRLRKQS